jgi:CRISPR-associated protein Csm4
MQYNLDKLFIAVIKPRRGEHALRWHVGGDMKGIENVSTIVHSDTLFSALCHAWVKLFGKSDLEDNLKIFNEYEPPFRISSIFPMDLTEEKYFVPKPCLPIPKPANQSVFLKYAKSLRDVDFIALDCLLDWLDLKNEEELEPEDCEELYEKIDSVSKEYQEVFWTGTEMGIETDRIGEISPNPFYRGSSITQKVGLTDYGYYFLAYCPDNRYIDFLDTLIEEVSISGIGGERSIGFGRFTAESLAEISDDWLYLFKKNNGSTNYLLLSLCYPTDQEKKAIDFSQARYSLIPRKGWFDSPTGYTFKRKRCNLFREGSFIPLNQRELRGKIVDVSPTIWENLEYKLDGWHRIYRYGVALGVPI